MEQHIVTESNPKVFISYSWSSERFKAAVRSWADRLMAAGVEVILDEYDLNEGDDVHAFMERMVLDQSVTHVLIICDEDYTKKADKRNSGVGVESRIISSELYDKVTQSKFIPIICKFKKNGDPCVPVYLKSRIGIDFSSPERVNQNWEQLIRLLYNKPRHRKPKLGEPPEYINSESSPPQNLGLLKARYEELERAVLGDSKNIQVLRVRFLESCLDSSDQLRVREVPKKNTLGKRILSDCDQLKNIRNFVIDWLILECRSANAGQIFDDLVEFLENLLELKAPLPNLNSWQPTWFDAHTVFLHQTFLYVVAALLKTRNYNILNKIFTQDYVLPEKLRKGGNSFDKFTCFLGYVTPEVENEITPPGKKLHNAMAEMVSRQSDRSDLDFNSLVEAELIIFMMSLVVPEASRWYPGTLHYVNYSYIPTFFLKASKRQGFENLSNVTGISDAGKLRNMLTEKLPNQKEFPYKLFCIEEGGLRHSMNLDNWFSES